MFNQFKLEVKNCINQIEFKFIFMFIWAISIGGFFITCIKNNGTYYQFIRGSNENFILMSTNTRAILMILALFFPLLSICIYAGSYSKERKENITYSIILRSSKGKYVVSKSLAIIAVTFLSFFIPLFINQILCYLVFPMDGLDNRWGIPNYDLIQSYSGKALFDLFRIQYPFIYNLLYILIYSILGSVLALLAYGISFINKIKRFQGIQVNVSIFIVVMIVSYVAQMLKINMLDYLSYVQPGRNGTFYGFIIITVLMLLSAIILIFKGYKKYEEKN